MADGVSDGGKRPFATGILDCGAAPGGRETARARPRQAGVSGDSRIQLPWFRCRDTPGPLGKTPAELLIGRRLRTTLPLHPNRLVPKTPNLKKVRKKDAVVREKQRQNYDRRHAARHLVPLASGDSVWVKDCRREDVICQRAKRPRSYVVALESGIQIERNRKFLVKQELSRIPDSYNETYEFPPSLENAEVGDQPTSKPFKVTPHRIRVMFRRRYQANTLHDSAEL
ncbi:uncharacterized protein LOC142565956 [Dermacentor variabilis]|uniref:uncharacterized protein LOC142565956 n=1 Tax=Dermacentor variabilis TaxID=34621 RepID=UPI003F5B9CCD